MTHWSAAVPTASTLADKSLLGTPPRPTHVDSEGSRELFAATLNADLSAHWVRPQLARRDLAALPQLTALIDTLGTIVRVGQIE
jgi:hypothetical protein